MAKLISKNGKVKTTTKTKAIAAPIIDDTGLFALLKSIMETNKIEDEKITMYIADGRERMEKKLPFFVEDKVRIFNRISGLDIDAKIKAEMILSLEQDFEEMLQSNEANNFMSI